jgi:hypothetical protein
VREVLAHIEAGGLLPPLVVLQALAANPALKLSVVKVHQFQIVIFILPLLHYKVEIVMHPWVLLLMICMLMAPPCVNLYGKTRMYLWLELSGIHRKEIFRPYNHSYT